MTARERLLRAITPYIDGALPFKGAAMADRLGLASHQYHGLLYELTSSGQIVRVGRGLYVWPGDPRIEELKARDLHYPEYVKPVADAKPKTFKPPKFAPGITLAQAMGRR